MQFHHWIRMLPVALVAVGSAAFAGQVEVTSRDPSRFTDIGNARWEEAGNVQLLSRHLQEVGQRLLPPDQTLRVEFLDIDLTGEVRANGARIVRRGAIDGPRMHVRYTLEQAGQVVASGEEHLSPVNFASGLWSTRYRRELEPERRLLEHWVQARFVDRLAAGR